MKLRALAAAMGIAEYPADTDAVYATLTAGEDVFCKEYYVRIERDYGAVGEYMPDVLAAAEELKKRPLVHRWARLGVACLCRTDGKPFLLPMPKSDGTPLGNLLTLLVHLGAVPVAYRRYRARGLSHEVAVASLGNIPLSVRSAEFRLGHLEVDGPIYSWINCYTTASIFRYGSLNFQPMTLGGQMLVLKSRKSGEYRILMAEGRFHRSGNVLGSGGCEDEEGAFSADFCEDDFVFLGHVAEEGLVSRERLCFKKDEWECVLRPGDYVANLHIPRGADISPDAVAASLKEGLRLMAECYGGGAPKGAVCYSWMLSPLLADFLGETAKLSLFMRQFTLFPIRDGGGAVVSRVFPDPYGKPLAEYPEDTALQRALKRHMLGGGYLLTTGGVILSTLR